MVALVDLEGTYGRINTDGSGGAASWLIEQSTFPWLKGTNLLEPSKGDVKVRATRCGPSLLLSCSLSPSLLLSAPPPLPPPPLPPPPVS